VGDWVPELVGLDGHCLDGWLPDCLTGLCFARNIYGGVVTKLEEHVTCLGSHCSETLCFTMNPVVCMKCAVVQFSGGPSLLRCQVHRFCPPCNHPSANSNDAGRVETSHRPHPQEGEGSLA